MSAKWLAVWCVCIFLASLGAGVWQANRTEVACIDGKVWHVKDGIATPSGVGLSQQECRIVAEVKQ